MIWHPFFVALLLLWSRELVEAAFSPGRQPPPTVTGTLHKRSFFYVGQTYKVNEDASGSISFGQIYVERLTPAEVTKALPLLFIHGSGMTATNFLNTPDGQMGWADYFLSKGYEVYLIDQPSRGRSPWRQSIDGPQINFDTHMVERLFTATKRFNLWPQASLHTQWPGNGSVGASKKMKAAGSELLDMIGPAIVITHSQAGQFGLILADSRPNLVKALISLEPSGPPFVNAIYPSPAPSRPYGLTEIPIIFKPPITTPSTLQPTAVNVTAHTPGSWLYTCYQQVAPARQLENLAAVQMLVVTAESGYHAVYDECTVNFLRQGGVERLDFLKLEDVGIRGNGHMFFMELNGLEIAEEVGRWMETLSPM
ncbi:hypothetical protein AX16_003548 [Volvariella volvacea WC 439]|nr:hypothetical protein AX16_003548 [Volvariella volvacea WC 439]